MVIRQKKLVERLIIVFGICFVFCIFVGINKVKADQTTPPHRLNRENVTKFVGRAFNLNLRGVRDTRAIWKSSNPRVADVSENGHVSCKKPGETVITAEFKGYIYQCIVIVQKPYISSKKIVCEIGDVFRVKLKGIKSEKYSIKDETVASVNLKGKIKTLRAGTTKLKIVDVNGKKYTCKIMVFDTKRKEGLITQPSKDSLETSKIKAKDVPEESFYVKPGTLVNFTNIIYKSGTPDGLVYLRKSDVSKKLSYNDYDCRLQKQVIVPLSEMIEDAYKEGKYKFTIGSAGGYRSYSTQDGYWQRRLRNTPSYGDDPYHNGVKCVPGVSSEHRTGYAIDFNTSDSGYKWLKDNSYKYGFIKRYYGDKTIYTGVMDEYWHFTYVGNDVAATCYYENICLEEYYEKYVEVVLDEPEEDNKSN